MSGRNSDDRGRRDGAPADAGAGRSGGGGDDYLYRPRGGIDPGDAVPEGVAPEEPAPLTEEEKRVLEKLRNLGRR
jgi:hypothetical protein